MCSGLPDGRSAHWLAELPPGGWQRVNRRLVAKALCELGYEELFHPEVTGVTGSGATSGGRVSCRLPLPGGAVYRYHGRVNVWGQVLVDPDSIRRDPAGPAAGEIDAQRFVLDVRDALDLDGPTAAGLLRELSQTLLADAWLIHRNRDLSAEQLIELPPAELEARLAGHPTMLVNKGRFGWGWAELATYAPEFAEPFQLRWLAVHRGTAVLARRPGHTEDDLLTGAMSAAELSALRARSAGLGAGPDTHAVLPVHPWQHDAVVVTQFTAELAAGRIVPLGRFGDRYRPLVSIRTLANADRPAAPDLKLALSILNTSVYRGIRDRWVLAGPALSDWLAGITGSDPVLRERNVAVLAELGGGHYPHPGYPLAPDVPYRYREQLGAIWRRSATGTLPAGDRPVLLAALADTDAAGRSLAGAFIRRSGAPAEQWLARLFDRVTVPLYHLLCRYGFGLIAHGQNVVVVLRDGLPAGLALKDFHGDLTTHDAPERSGLPAEIGRLVSREPDDIIVGNLLWVHLIIALRPVADLLAAEGTVAEPVFYRLLAATLRRYVADHPELADSFARYDLFRSKIPRFCLNRVRLAAGYGETGSRPPKLFGTPLDNPLNRY